tara:strand:+ start:1532 stop:2038 length:507 start_codon:yes stop_codon:yes gene_type:complete
MNKSVNLYLASGVSDGVGFWLVNFTEDNNIVNSLDSKLLECYRKELFGIEAAIEVREAINTTLDILTFDSKNHSYELDDFTKVYSSEIPLDIVEDIYDLWAYNYSNDLLWKKYIGVLNFRRKIKSSNNFINLGLKGTTYDFAMKLDELLRFKPVHSSFDLNKSNELMW